jgi:hypothetical protein
VSESGSHDEEDLVQSTGRWFTAGVFGLAAIAVLVALVVVLPAAAKQPGVNGPIVFAKFLPGRSSGDTPLFTVNSDGSGQRRLVAASSCCAAWSPDGGKIAVSSLSPDGRVTTALVNADGSNLDVKTIPDPSLNLECDAWSPDGGRMLCAGWDDKHKDRPRGLFTVRVSDWGDLKQLMTNPDGAQGMNDDPADYSPDGKRILFIREIGQHDDALYSASTNGSSLKPIPTGSLNPDCCSASWSPDGKWILFSVLGSIQAVHPDGSGLHSIALKARCVNPSGPAVLAGSRVYRLHCLKGRFAMNPNVLYWVAFLPSWSPDGKKMVFSLAVQTSATRGTQGVYTANANGTDLKPITTPTAVKKWRSLDFPDSTDWGPLKR